MEGKEESFDLDCLYSARRFDFCLPITISRQTRCQPATDKSRLAPDPRHTPDDVEWAVDEVLVFLSVQSESSESPTASCEGPGPIIPRVRRDIICMVRTE